MSYLQKSLLSGEKIAFETKMHWVSYLNAILLNVLTGMTAFLTGGTFGVIVAALGVFILLQTILRDVNTEVGVTDRRVFAKTGIIRRNTFEMRNSKIETVDVKQGIIGRILGYGTISFVGTGGSKSEVKCIANPFAFREAALSQME